MAARLGLERFPAYDVLELFAFGVDNRYTQQDIEQLARCFTGWGICKVPLEQMQGADPVDKPLVAGEVERPSSMQIGGLPVGGVPGGTK